MVSAVEVQVDPDPDPSNPSNSAVMLLTLPAGACAASAAHRRPCRRPRSLVTPMAQWQGCNALTSPVKVVGMGSCAVDYLASVAAYPRPDEKLRTETLEVQGGGNCANALTAAARLGLSPIIVTKIGSDGLGDGILSELQADKVDTTHVLRAANHPSPFTYIIVDKAGSTRTCIHTPGAPFAPDEMLSPGGGPELMDSILHDAALVYFDGRLTEAAMLLAARARQLGVPVLVEAERLRPGLDGLLALADYVVTSAHFPREWTGEQELADALLVTAQRLPAARFVITTLGSRGSVMLCREEQEGAQGQGQQQQQQQQQESSCSLKQLLSELEEELASGEAPAKEQGEQQQQPVCVSRTGVGISAGRVASTSGRVALRFSDGRSSAAAEQARAAAAARAAAMNADAGNSARYAGAGASPSPSQSGGPGGRPSAELEAPLIATVLRASAAVLPKEAVVDTTGAGDSFIGSVLYGLATGMAYDATLRLAAVVAACKCTELGARAGLPRRRNLAAALLHTQVPQPQQQEQRQAETVAA